MKVRSKFWFVDDQGEAIFGEGRRKMLELIDELGSMQAAAKTLNMSYRGVWARIKATEERMGFKLLSTSVGRGKNRGSRLTPAAKKLLRDYKELTGKGRAETDRLFATIVEGKGEEPPHITPAVAVVGPSGSGKDKLIAALIKAWAGRNRKIGLIVMEPANRDADQASDRALEAGAPLVIRNEGESLVLNLGPEADLTPESLAANFSLGCDLVLVKSNERLNLPTIEIYKQAFGEQLLTRKRKNIAVVVGDPPPPRYDWPYCPLEDLESIMDRVESVVKTRAGEDSDVRLTVDGKRVPMLPFVQDIFVQAVAGMVSSLKSCRNPGEIELKINLKNYQ